MSSSDVALDDGQSATRPNTSLDATNHHHQQHHQQQQQQQQPLISITSPISDFSISGILQQHHHQPSHQPPTQNNTSTPWELPQPFPPDGSSLGGRPPSPATSAPPQLVDTTTLSSSPSSNILLAGNNDNGSTTTAQNLSVRMYEPLALDLSQSHQHHSLNGFASSHSTQAASLRTVANSASGLGRSSMIGSGAGGSSQMLASSSATLPHQSMLHHHLGASTHLQQSTMINHDHAQQQHRQPMILTSPTPEAAPTAELPEKVDEPQRNIFVAGLPGQFTDTQLRTLFSQFGEIESVKVDNAHHFGFVKYKEPQPAAAAIAKLHNTFISPQSTMRLHVSHALHSEEATANERVFIRGLPSFTTAKQLEELFSPFGTIIDHSIIQFPNGACKGAGFVRFETAESATAAIHHFSGEEGVQPTLVDVSSGEASKVKLEVKYSESETQRQQRKKANRDRLVSKPGAHQGQQQNIRFDRPMMGHHHHQLMGNAPPLAAVPPVFIPPLPHLLPPGVIATPTPFLPAQHHQQQMFVPNQQASQQQQQQQPLPPPMPPHFLQLSQHLHHQHQQPFTNGVNGTTGGGFNPTPLLFQQQQQHQQQQQQNTTGGILSSSSSSSAAAAPAIPAPPPSLLPYQPANNETPGGVVRAPPTTTSTTAGTHQQDTATMLGLRPQPGDMLLIGELSAIQAIARFPQVQSISIVGGGGWYLLRPNVVDPSQDMAHVQQAVKNNIHALGLDVQCMPL